MEVCATSRDLVLLFLQFVYCPIQVSALRTVSRPWKYACEYWIERWYIPWICTGIAPQRLSSSEACWKVPYHLDFACSGCNNESCFEARKKYYTRLARDFAVHNEGYVFKKIAQAEQARVGVGCNVYEYMVRAWHTEEIETHDRPDCLKFMLKCGRYSRGSVITHDFCLNVWVMLENCITYPRPRMIQVLLAAVENTNAKLDDLLSFAMEYHAEYHWEGISDIKIQKCISLIASAVHNEACNNKTAEYEIWLDSLKIVVPYIDLEQEFKAKFLTPETFALVHNYPLASDCNSDLEF